jgi:small subunit ribosomal protein S8
MRLTDPVADMLARIRNAIRARHQKVDIPASKLKTEIARILKEEGFIANFKPTEEEGHKVLRVYLKYGNNNEAVISNLARVSRPGCRVYGRSRNQHPDHAEGRHDRTPGAPAGLGR